MTKYELLNLVRDLTETIKTNSNTMEALTFQVRDMQNDADVLKTQKNAYINRINWISKKYIQLQKTVKGFLLVQYRLKLNKFVINRCL